MPAKKGPAEKGPATQGPATEGPATHARWVALLRGINLGRRRVPMPSLVGAFESAGCGQVSTYVQSGNVLFSPPPAFRDLAGATDPAATELVQALEAAVQEAAGFAAPIVLRSSGQLEAVIGAAPFGADDPATVHVAFLGAEPTPDAVAAFGKAATDDEAFSLAGRDLYLHLPNGMGRSKLGVAVDRLKVPVTVRNWRTVTTLADLTRDQ